MAVRIRQAANHASAWRFQPEQVADELVDVMQVSNLMGLRPKAEPVILVRAIIDRAFVPVSAGPHSSDEVIDLD